MTNLDPTPYRLKRLGGILEICVGQVMWIVVCLFPQFPVGVRLVLTLIPVPLTYATFCFRYRRKRTYYDGQRILFIKTNWQHDPLRYVLFDEHERIIPHAKRWLALMSVIPLVALWLPPLIWAIQGKR